MREKSLKLDTQRNPIAKVITKIKQQIIPSKLIYKRKDKYANTRIDDRQTC